MKQAFDDLLTHDIFALNTQITMYLPQSMYITNFEEKPSIKREFYGNVVDDSSYDFQIEVREDKYEEVKTMKTFPIQVQVEYTRKNGMKGMTVFTKSIEVAREEEDVELDGDVVQKYYIKQSALKAKQGRIEEA